MQAAPSSAWSTRSGRAASTPSASFQLSPFTLGELRLLLAGKKAVQVTLKSSSADLMTSEVRRAYEAVSEEITDVIAAVIHLEIQGKLPPPHLVFEGSTYALTCYRSSWSNMCAKWQWKVDGKEVQGNSAKFRFVFAEKQD